MKAMIMIMLAAGIVGVAAAYDLGNQAPIKPQPLFPQNIPGVRQGGDTIADAFVVPALPFSDSGTTAGYADDYDEVCPYTGSTSPDVCYKFTPAGASSINIDLCYSSYDTKLYVYDSSLSPIACNDDFYFSSPCFVYSSKLEDVPMAAGETYYIIIDGYYGAFGAYQMDIDMCCPPPCTLDCPTYYGVPEGEPALVNDYVDNWNGGCSAPGFPFQDIHLWCGLYYDLCGVSGWYNYQGIQYRDTDWYRIVMNNCDIIEVTADAEYESYFFELGPQDCDFVDVVQQITAGPCSESSMTISGFTPGSPVWFWVGPTNYSAPSLPYEYDYVVWFSGGSIATEPTTWSTVKALYE